LAGLFFGAHCFARADIPPTFKIPDNGARNTNEPMPAIGVDGN
jgi:hypothetical protein